MRVRSKIRSSMTRFQCKDKGVMGMKMKKSWVLPVLAAGILAAGLAGCEKKDPYGLSAKDPVTITIWHYYCLLYTSDAADD